MIDVDAVPDTEGNDTALSELHAESPAYVLYTSGSTGRPKGVVVTHGNLRASNAARLLSYDARPNRFLLLPSVAFDSSVAGIFWTLASGGTLVIPDDEEVKDPHRLTELVAHERVSTLLCVPSLYASMLAAGGSQLSGLTTAIVAGERCPSQLVRSHFRTIPGVRLFNEYGPTEATVWATVHEIREPDAKDPVPIGRPIPGVQVHVLDTLGRAVPAGVPGRGWIAGPTVSGGYWKQPSLTRERFVVGASAQSPHQRMYDSGDRLTWASDGTLLFLGREDDQIKLRGYRIEPGEIEAALTAQPGIEDAAVVSSASASAAQLVAFVRLTSAAAARDHRQGLENQLPSFMVPQRVVEVPDLPRLPNGKLDRAQLEQMALDLPVFAAGDEPTTALEEALVSLWKGLLDRPNLGTTDNFVELGGHSLLVVEMTDNIARDHGVTLTAADVFQNPTVKELARQIEQQGRPARYTHLFPLQPGGRETPFIMAIPHFFSEMLAERFRGERPVYGLRGVGIRTEGNAGRWRTMTDLGEELVEEIERRFPDEPCLVGGYSFGASMAFEVARLMEQRGNPAKRLYMIAPMALDVYRLGPWRVQLNGLRGATTDLSLGEALRLLGPDLNPLTRLPYQRASQLLAVRPWRRLLASVGRLYRSAGRPLPARVLNADVRAERFRLHRGYRPQAIRTPTVMFNPTDGETDAAATWRPYFEGRLTICDTPDPHHDAESVSAARTVILQGLRDLDDR